MLALRRAARAASLLACLLLFATAAAAQGPTVVKFPGGPDVVAVGPGQFSVLAGGVIRWSVVLDNTSNPEDILFNYLDRMDPDALVGCGADPPCPNAQHLELLCDPPDAPDPDGGTVVECNPVLGRLDIRSIPVPSGGSSCVQFSTRVRPSGRFAGQIFNIGCVDVTFPLPSSTYTRPTTAQFPACTPVPSSGLTTDCSGLFVPNVEPPDFAGLKTATVEDTNGNGQTDVGDIITWTVAMTNEGTEEHDGWAFDTIPPGVEFLDIVDNPDGLCSFTGTEIDCPALHFLGGETKTLTFRTTIACSSITDDDTYDACNQATMCTNAARTACGPSDNDTTLPPNPTCVDVVEPNFTSATKVWRFQDLDADGALSAGDRVFFTIRVVNEGTATAFQVRVDDVLEACFDDTTLDPGNAFYDPPTRALRWDLSDMAPGAFEDLPFSAVVLVDAGPCCNQAGITHASREACGLPPVLTDDPTTPAADDPSCLRFGPQPVVVAEKDFELTDDVDGDGTVDAGDEVTLTITLRNTGQGAATNVVLDDLLLPCWEGFSLASLTFTGTGTNESTELTPPMTPNRVRFTGIGGPDGLDPLGAETFTVTFPVRVTTLGQCCNQADVTFDESAVVLESDDPTTPLADDPTCTSRTAPQARFEIDKTFAEFDGDGCVERGEDITFTITITARDARATLVTLQDAIADPAGVFGVIDPTTGTYDPATDTITWNVPDLNRDETRVITWIGRFACDAPDGSSSSDTATVSSFNGAPASDGATVTLNAPDLRVGKSMTYDDRDASGTFSAGDTAVFTIDVTNAGSCPAEAVALADVLDPDLDVTLAVPDRSGTSDGAGNVGWDPATTPELATLAPGAAETFTLRVPVLDPATNPNPARDGIVANEATGTAAGSPACPISVTSLPVSDTIAVVSAVLDAKVAVADTTGEGCFATGEELTIILTVAALGGAGTDVVSVLTFDDPLGLLQIIDPDGGTLGGPPTTLTWNHGAIAADASVVKNVRVLVRCDAPNAEIFNLRHDATSSNLPADAATADRLPVAAPILTVTKSFSWNDDGNGILDPGESVKYLIQVSNAGSCQVRNIDVVDIVDHDLDVTAITVTPFANDDGTGGITWTGIGLDPGSSIDLTLEAPTLDPATNPDPNANALVFNEASAVATSATCPPVAFTGAAPEAAIGQTVGVYRLLRSDFITCRTDAFATMRTELLRPRPAPQECSEPPAIDPAHRGTQIVDDVTSPVSFTGDADPAFSFARCPQSPAGFGRVLVFYELDEPSPRCVTTLRVTKSGGAVEVSW